MAFVQAITYAFTNSIEDKGQELLSSVKKEIREAMISAKTVRMDDRLLLGPPLPSSNIKAAQGPFPLKSLDGAEADRRSSSAR
jgi:hypothetical protein